MGGEDSRSTIGRASYTDNGSFGNYWDLVILNNGSLNSKKGRYLITPKYEDSVTVNIGKSKIISICNEIEELGFFSLPEDIGAKYVPADGPIFFIELACTTKRTKVRLYPEFLSENLNEDELNETVVFSKTWSILWKKSGIIPPSPLGDEKL